MYFFSLSSLGGYEWRSWVINSVLDRNSVELFYFFRVGVNSEKFVVLWESSLFMVNFFEKVNYVFLE